MAGEYIVELTVTDDVGETSTATCPLVEAIPAEDLRIEMFWSIPSDDMDLWLIKPGDWDSFGCNVFTESTVKSNQCFHNFSTLVLTKF